MISGRFNRPFALRRFVRRFSPSTTFRVPWADGAVQVHVRLGDLLQEGLTYDAIINSANETLEGPLFPYFPIGAECESGHVYYQEDVVDGRIHRAGGPALSRLCRKVPELPPSDDPEAPFPSAYAQRCEIGGARLTEVPGTSELASYCRYVVHAVAPIWAGDLDQGEQERRLRLLSKAYESAFQATEDAASPVYIDDRTVTCNSASNLFRMFTAWQSWSQSVGLVESVSKTRVAAARPAMAVVAGRFFEGGVVQPAVKVLGAVSACARRALHSAEAARLAEAKKVIRLLACCHFLLDNHLRCVRQFAISKANFGWVSRSPTWAMSHRLFTASFVVWVTRLVAAILRFRLRSGALPSWSGKRGSCAACLRQWMAVKGFTELHPWTWFHEYAHVKVDLAGRVTAQSVGSRVGLCQHNVRQGWRAWVFQRWLGSGRHELLRLPQLSCDNTRNWILSAAPLPLGPRLALVIGRSCLLQSINLLSVSGGVGMSGSGITSVGLALVVLHRLLSDLFAPSLQGLDGSPKIQAGSLIRSLTCGTGWPPASLVSGRLRRLR
eukprot:symbB.v1.2.007026.t1/scaffold428.1/size206322/1